MATMRNTPTLGYRVEGGKLELEESTLRTSTAVLGEGAEEVTSCFATPLAELYGRIAIVDICGGLWKTLSGHIDAYESSYVMHDSLCLSENGQLHGRLLASAYSTVANLPSSQEELLNAAIQQTALEEGEGSPMGLVPMIAIVEGFRDSDKSELVGRIAALRFIESAGDAEVVKKLLRSSFLVDFSHSRSPELSEASAAAFLAKLLSYTDTDARPEALVINGAERLFGSFRIPLHGSYLRTFLIGGRCSMILSSPSGSFLDRFLLEACPLRLYSSALWNATGRDPRVLPNSFVMQNLKNGATEAFVPREIEPSPTIETKGTAPSPVDVEIERRILEFLRSSESSTRIATISVLSSEYPANVVAGEIDRLLIEGLIAPVKATGSFSAPLVLLDQGKKRILELGDHG
jgi:hypothetical protein